MKKILNKHEITMQSHPPNDYLIPFVTAVLFNKGINCPVEVTLKIAGETQVIIIDKKQNVPKSFPNSESESSIEQIKNKKPFV